MRKILITGGAGFIGSSLAEKLIDDNENYVVVVDDLSTGNPQKLPNITATNWKFIKCNVNNYDDISAVMLSYQFNYVFHYAAMVGVDRTQEYPVKVLEDIKGFENILNLAKNTGVKRIFFSSSSEIYGESVEMPQHEETTPLNSRLPYAIVKNVGEAFLRSYKQEYNLDYTIFRFFNTYGPKQDRDFVISKFIYKALKNEAITIYGNGKQTRTFCYIDDNIDVCLNVFYEDKIVNDVVNIGGDIEVPIIDLANLIIKLTKSKSKIVYLPPLEEGDMSRRQPDVTKMKNLLNHELLPLEKGIQKILDKGLFELKHELVEFY